MKNLSDIAYELMRKSWPYWVVVGVVNDVTHTTEVQAKSRLDANATAHAEFTGLSGISYIKGCYGPYRKEAE